jgi:hypothetical protein
MEPGVGYTSSYCQRSSVNRKFSKCINKWKYYSHEEVRSVGSVRVSSVGPEGVSVPSGDSADSAVCLVRYSLIFLAHG